MEKTEEEERNYTSNCHVLFITVCLGRCQLYIVGMGDRRCGVS